MTATVALAKPEHYATRIKRELSEAREEIAALKRIRDELQSPEVPVYATIFDGHSCIHFADKGNERNRAYYGAMDLIELFHRANGSPVFDISGQSVSDVMRIADLPLSERVAAWDALFVPRIDRRLILSALNR